MTSSEKAQKMPQPPFLPSSPTDSCLEVSSKTGFVESRSPTLDMYQSTEVLKGRQVQASSRCALEVSTQSGASFWELSCFATFLLPLDALQGGPIEP